MRLHTDDIQIVSGILPVDLSSADNDGDFVNLSKYRSAMIVLHKGAGTAGQDPTLTIQQAKDVDGTDVKGLDFDTIYVKQGTLTSIGQFTKTEQTPASTFTVAGSAELEAIWVVVIDVASLDINGGFKTMRARIADVGAAEQLGGLLYILSQPREHKSPLDSALVD